MKLSATIFLFPLFAQAQQDTCRTFDTANVVVVQGTSAQELYARAKRWFALNFKDAQEVIQMDDPVNCSLIGKGTIDVGYGWYNFTVEVACKDARYRYSIQDLNHTNPGSTYSSITKSYIPNIAYGTLYDCDLCCDEFRRWRSEHPMEQAKNRKNVKTCREGLVFRAKRELAEMIQSLNTGMSTQTSDQKDW